MKESEYSGCILYSCRKYSNEPVEIVLSRERGDEGE
jgi:hypothetical protein